MPANARVLSVDDLSLFVLLDPSATFIERKFMWIATDEAFDETSFQSDYLGSCFAGGQCFHVVEVV